MSNEVKKGDTPDLPKAPGGDQRSASHDPEFVRQMRHAEEIMPRRLRGAAGLGGVIDDNHGTLA